VRAKLCCSYTGGSGTSYDFSGLVSGGDVTLPDDGSGNTYYFAGCKNDPTCVSKNAASTGPLCQDAGSSYFGCGLLSSAQFEETGIPGSDCWVSVDRQS
jgi:hypothetical protein